MELITLIVTICLLLFGILLGLGCVWVYMGHGRSIWLPLLFTFGIAIVGLLFVLGLLLNWSIVWGFLVAATNSKAILLGCLFILMAVALGIITRVVGKEEKVKERVIYDYSRRR